MNWDDAYANGAHIPGAEGYPPRWEAQALAFREAQADRFETHAYGSGARNKVDVFHPETAPLGLAVFVHGGYWMRFDAGTWSHLAAGASSNGWAVALPSYTLCPDARISDITQEIAAAVTLAAGLVDGPIHLAGHSAGGHLVTRMICDTGPLDAGTAARIEHTLSISGVHDLRPLRRTQMNTNLFIDGPEAAAESPVLLEPREGTHVTCWVGADERPEFVRQNALLANIWTGLGAVTRCIEEPGRHHFDVIEALTDPESAITNAWIGNWGE